ncbi:Hsp70-binding protein 1 [Halotydeus destructor]|nr:Hsp70-binding protein 1 [Halotydeus destructor]
MSDSRQPHDLQGLLRLAVANQVSSEDADGSNDVDVTDPERKQWLAEAVDTLRSDPVAEMKKGVASIQRIINEAKTVGLSKEAHEDLIYTLDVLVDYVGSIDLANDFNKLGGMALISTLLKLSSDTIKAKTCDLLAEMSQNNPTCQDLAVEHRLLDTLVRLVDKDEDDNVRVKSLYAVSCVIRDHDRAQAEFVADHEGLEVLLRALHHETENHKLRIKASFLLTALCLNSDIVKDKLFQMGFVPKIIDMLRGEHDMSHEYLLGALNALITNHEDSKLASRNPDLKFAELLRNKINSLNGKIEYSEELHYANSMMKTCFPAS